jgi:two-component system C4-dicarboxylate transport sensor histidine kinase DctB
LTDHPSLVSLADGTASDAEAANDFLLEAMDKTAALGLSYYNHNGEVLASAARGKPQDVRGQAYFKRALNGALGVAHGVRAGDRKRVFYYAAPHFSAEGPVSAVLVVMVDVEMLENEWRGGQPTVYFSDRDRQVFISYRSELLGRGPRDPIKPLIPSKINRIGYADVWDLDWGPYVPKAALHLSRNIPTIGMVAEALVDISNARRLAALQAAFVMATLVVFAGTLLWVTERRRALALANATLERRIAARTRELEKAQADLVQAGKLSALGQMSAGISHELNQPLMAIQQYSMNAVQFAELGKHEAVAGNLDQINSLAGRMARIIKNLRAFARNESEPMGRVDLVAVVDAAVELSAARLAQEGVALAWERPSDPVWVRAGEVRMGQVVLNLMTNAVDAMSESAEKTLKLAISDDVRARLEVTDTGPGIDQPEKIFDPFYTTKAIGAADGMGLGLSISYGLVQSFGGDIRGENTPNGARFTVELEKWT